jgi:hypothetical protein
MLRQGRLRGVDCRQSQNLWVNSIHTSDIQTLREIPTGGCSAYSFRPEHLTRLAETVLRYLSSEDALLMAPSSESGTNQTAVVM